MENKQNYQTKMHCYRILKWAEDLNRHLTKEDIQTANKHMKRCSMSHVIKETQIKTTARHYYTPLRMAKIQNTDITKYRWGCGVTGTLTHCWWECKVEQPFF